MSEQSSQEPTMEEILASIRRIISEDDTPAEEGAAPPAAEAAPAPPEPEPEPAAAAAPAPEPEPEPPAEPAPVEALVEPMAVAASQDEDDDDDLELTQKVETHGDLDVLAPTEPE